MYGLCTKSSGTPWRWGCPPALLGSFAAVPNPIISQLHEVGSIAQKHARCLVENDPPSHRALSAYGKRLTRCFCRFYLLRTARSPFRCSVPALAIYDYGTAHQIGFSLAIFRARGFVSLDYIHVGTDRGYLSRCMYLICAFQETLGVGWDHRHLGVPLDKIRITRHQYQDSHSLSIYMYL